METKRGEPKNPVKRNWKKKMQPNPETQCGKKEDEEDHTRAV